MINTISFNKNSLSISNVNTNRLTQVQKAFILTTVILMFHILRNVSMFGYVFLLFSSYGWLYATYIYNNFFKRQKKFKFSFIKLIFLLSLLWLPVISLLNMDFASYLNALPRFFVTFPYIFFVILYEEIDQNLLILLLRFYVLFMTLSGLTIPFQIIFGPIPFLAESSMRAGLDRYSTLAGSLTAMGTLGAYSIVILLFSKNLIFNKIQKFFLLFTNVFCMLLSMQKAAVINLIICFGLFYLIKNEMSLLKKFLSVTLVIILLLFLYNSFSNSDFFRYIDSIITYTFTSSNLDYADDFLVRLWELPSKVVVYHKLKFSDILFGIGFSALAGTMGNPQYPMAHNNYCDLLFSGGITHFCIFLYLTLRIPVNLFKRKLKQIKIQKFDNMYNVIVFLFLINMGIGASNFFQPVTAVIIFLTLFSYPQIKEE